MYSPHIYPDVIFYLGEGVSLGHWFASGDAIDSFSAASIDSFSAAHVNYVSVLSYSLKFISYITYIEWHYYNKY